MAPTRSRQFLAQLSVLAVLLAGCSGGTPPAKPGSGTGGTPAATTPAATVKKGATSVAEIMVSYQAMEAAIITFRNLEAANTDSTGLLRAAGYAAASSDMQKKRDAFNRMLAETSSADVPQIEAVRQAFAPVASTIKAYSTVTTVNGVLSGPDARASTANYLLFVAASAKFKKAMTTMQTQEGTVNADLGAADKAYKDALAKYYDLVNNNGDAAAVKAAAAEVERTKARLAELQKR